MTLRCVNGLEEDQRPWISSGIDQVLRSRGPPEGHLLLDEHKFREYRMTTTYVLSMHLDVR